MNAANSQVNVTTSTDVDIFGATRQNNITVTASQDIGIFGVSEGSVTLGSLTSAQVQHATVHISDFGSTASSTLNMEIANSADVDIFGTSAANAANLQLNVNASQDVGIFGNGARNVSMQVTTSQDIGIFGIVDGAVVLGPTNPATSGQGVQRAIIEAASFGGTAQTLTLQVSNSVDVDIFGGRAETAATLNASVSNSQDIGIFGSLRPGGNVQVATSQDIGIFAQASSSVSLSRVTHGTIFTEVFGTTRYAPRSS